MMLLNSALRRIAWLFFVIILLFTDIKTAKQTWEMATVPYPGPGGGPSGAYQSYHSYVDGRSVATITNCPTGISYSILLEPATWEGLMRVWWPATFSVILSYLAVWCFWVEGDRSLMRSIGSRRISTRGTMVLIVVVAIETFAFREWDRRTIFGLGLVNWREILNFFAWMNLLMLLAVGILLSHASDLHQQRSIRPV